MTDLRDIRNRVAGMQNNPAMWKHYRAITGYVPIPGNRLLIKGKTKGKKQDFGYQPASLSEF